MRRRNSVVAAVLLVGMAVMPVPCRRAPSLTIGGGVNQGCISMRITYSTCGIIPYPCAHISFWQPRWIVTTTPAFSGGVQNQGKPHYHLHNAVVQTGGPPVPVQRPLHRLHGADPGSAGAGVL